MQQRNVPTTSSAFSQNGRRSSLVSRTTTGPNIPGSTNVRSSLSFINFMR